MTAIEFNHETPIRFEDLTKLFNACSQITIDNKILKRRFFVVAGTFINPPSKLRQDFTSLDEMVAKQDESALLLLELVKTLKRRGVSPKPLPEWTEKQKAARAASSKNARQKSAARTLTLEEELQKFGISKKTIESMDRKAHSKYAGPEEPDYMRITDPVRVTLFAKDHRAINNMANYFRPCINPAVVAFEHSFACKDDEKGIRRLMINLRLRNGCIVEIQVLNKDAEIEYDRSHKKYRIERSVDEAQARTNSAETLRKLGNIL